MPKSLEITVKAPVNIALIKYWGKRNEVIFLPFFI
jgi:mevalonate pyrophosphate decarboxylase